MRFWVDFAAWFPFDWIVLWSFNAAQSDNFHRWLGMLTLLRLVSLKHTVKDGVQEALTVEYLWGQEQLSPVHTANFCITLLASWGSPTKWPGIEPCKGLTCAESAEIYLAHVAPSLHLAMTLHKQHTQNRAYRAVMLCSQGTLSANLKYNMHDLLHCS